MKLLKDHWGNSVRLTEERLQHILEHPEMADMKEAIAATLKTPQIVIQSKTDSNSALFYQYYVGTAVGDKWLCVVVKYEGEDAFVLTSYLTNRIKKGEQLWPKK